MASPQTPDPPKKHRKKVSDLTAEETCIVGTKFDLKLTGELNTQTGHVVFYICVLLVLWACFSEIASHFLDLLSMNIAFAGFMLILLGLDGFKASTVTVPSYTAVVVRDVIFGWIHVYYQGTHLKYWWQVFTNDDFINMRRDVLKKTSSFKSQDGITITVQWTLQYRPVPRMVGLYNSTEHEDFENGLIDIVENKLKDLFAAVKVRDFREKSEISESINKDLARNLREDILEKDVTIEERFGLEIENATIGPPTYNEDYDQAIQNQVVRAIISDDAQELAKALDISKGEALNMIAIFNKEAVKKDIKEFSIGQIVLDALAKAGVDVEKMLNEVRKVREASKPKTDTTNPPDAGETK